MSVLKKISRNDVIFAIIIVAIIIVYLQFIAPLLFPIFGSIDESVRSFILTIVLSALLGIAHKIKEKYKKRFERPFHLVERFALIMLPLQSAIYMINSVNSTNGIKISLYWIYFPFIICSVLWIGGGLYCGGYDLIKKNRMYRGFFIMGCIILIGIGLGLHNMLNFVYYCEPHKLFPWLEPIMKCGIPK